MRYTNQRILYYYFTNTANLHNYHKIVVIAVLRHQTFLAAH